MKYFISSFLIFAFCLLPIRVSARLATNASLEIEVVHPNKLMVKCVTSTNVGPINIKLNLPKFMESNIISMHSETKNDSTVTILEHILIWEEFGKYEIEAVALSGIDESLKLVTKTVYILAEEGQIYYLAPSYLYYQLQMHVKAEKPVALSRGTVEDQPWRQTVIEEEGYWSPQTEGNVLSKQSILQEDWQEVNKNVESPHNYSNNYSQTWTISHSGATKMRVYFSRFDTESGWDYVYILDGSNNQIASYTGAKSPFWSAEVNGDVIKIRLVTDGSVTAFGFRIDKYSYQTDGGSSSGTEWQTVNYSISSPHPYTNNYVNTWTITRTGAQKMKVHFSSFETERNWDYVYILDGNNTQIAQYDGSRDAFWSTEVSGSTIKIRLSTDGSVTKRGFDIDQYSYLGSGGDGGGSVSLIIQGTMRYKDKTGQNQPIRYGRIEVYDKDIIFDSKLGETATGLDGSYSISVQSSENNGPDIYVRVVTEGKSGYPVSNNQITTIKDDILSAYYYMESQVYSDIQQSGILTPKLSDFVLDKKHPYGLSCC